MSSILDQFYDRHEMHEIRKLNYSSEEFFGYEGKSLLMHKFKTASGWEVLSKPTPLWPNFSAEQREQARRKTLEDCAWLLSLPNGGASRKIVKEPLFSARNTVFRLAGRKP